MTTGGCACGALKYLFDGEPAAIALCHCDSCRRDTSSAYSSNLMLQLSAFHLIAGTPKTFTLKGGSGKDSTRNFCPRCGSLIYIESAAAPGMVFVKAGTLDDLKLNETKLKPHIEMFAGNKYSWLPDIEGVHKIEGAN